MAPDMDLAGLWVPVVTPFTAEGALDLPALRALGRRVLSDGAIGLVALGTTGEPATLTDDERRQVVLTCDEVAVERDRQLIVGVGTNSTATTLDGLQMLESLDSVVAALVVVPYYSRPAELAVVEHFRIVADASPAPVVMYNVPYRTGRGLSARSLLDAGDHPNIVGLKQAVGTLDQDTLELLARRDRGFELLVGDDAFIAPTVLLGGCGAIAAAAHVATPVFAEMIRAARLGDVTVARSLAASLLPVVTAGTSEPSPAVWKGALHRMGEIASPTLRRPMTSASNDAVDRLVAAVARVGD